MQYNSLAPIPEYDDEVQLPDLVYWASLGDVEQVEQGLQKGLDVNSADEEGYSALQAAAENDHLEVVKLLVSKGADIAHRSPNTALELAEMAGNKDVVTYLKSLAGGV